MARKILVVAPGQDPQILEESLAADEKQLQERIKENPELLPIEDLQLSGPLMVVGRETSVASGSIDLVGISRSGDLVLVEFKTGPQNPDFRHVIAQLIDYGSQLWQMDVEEFESTVALRYFNSDRCGTASPGYRARSLQEAALKTWPTMNDEEFGALRDRLGSQLARGAFHYVAVAQRFTDPMLRTVEYLNNTVPTAFFSAIELVRFDGADRMAFEGRTVFSGARHTGASKAVAQSISEATFLEAVVDDSYRNALKEFFDFCEGLQLSFEWGTKGVSIRIPTPDRSEPLSIAWAFPPGVVGWYGLADLTLGFDANSATQTPSMTPHLEGYVRSIAELDGATPAKPKSLTAYTLGPTAVTSHLDALKEAVASLQAG